MDIAALIDAAVDRAGLREPATLLTAEEPLPTFMVDFRQPQRVVIDQQAHITMTTIEYTTGAVRQLEENDLVQVRGTVYRIVEPPTLLQDGSWSIADLEVSDG
jgi:hypothetical protein